MSNVIGMKEFAGMANSDSFCWLCQKPVSIRAFFCSACGTVQPVRAIDHFVRLGLERRLDVDLSALEYQYVTLLATLSPDRFSVRGMGERGHAAKQTEALNEAFETLRDPLRRGRYWLSLNTQPVEASEGGDVHPIVNELRTEMVNAMDPVHCDRVAQKAGQALEQGVMLLMQALRGENWRQASMTLTQIDGVGALLDEVRARREELALSAE